MDISDFNPWSSWEVKSRLIGERSETYLEDQSTNKEYDDLPKNFLRVKCFLLSLSTPIVQPIAVVVSIISKIVNLLIFYPLWSARLPKDSSLSNRLIDYGIDFIKLFSAPFVLVGLGLSSLYGIISPYNGRKLYASFEKLQYGNVFSLAPDFQPKIVVSDLDE